MTGDRGELLRQRGRFVTTSESAFPSDDLVLGDATAGALTYTLPLASSVVGRVFTLIKVDSSFNAVTLSRADSDLINAATTVVLALQFDIVQVVAALVVPSTNTYGYLRLI